MTSLPAPSPVPAWPADRTDRPGSAIAATSVPPDLGTRAVTAPEEGAALRQDPDPPRPPKLPAPIRGLGIPPLDTRHVGDFDRIDHPPAPPGADLSDRLADLQARPPADVDLRR